jgi:predicted nucleic acid-binding protein
VKLIREGKIGVRRPPFWDYNVLDHYNLGKGEKESIVLTVEMGDEMDFIVTDDRLAYVVIDRMGIKKLLFLDLIVELVERTLMDLELARSIIDAIESRYPEGFIYHTLKILERGDRKCLK